MLQNFYVYTITQLTNNLLVGTSYGPLFLDETDFALFEFDPNWLINNIDTYEAHALLNKIKAYYIDQAIKLYMEGELS